MSRTLTIEVARKYLSPVFFETGTNEGGAVDLALEAGYDDVLSVDNDNKLYLAARAKFAKLANVRLFYGSSDEVLRNFAYWTNRRITFWLDAHDMDGAQSPLLRELHVIRGFSQSHHVIMIDDRRALAQWGFTEAAVAAAALRINPHYKLTLEDSRIAKNDIMVFHL